MEWKVDETDGGVRVVLSGEITEDSDFPRLAEKVAGNTVIDLGDVSRINSCGVREWINFLASVKDSTSALRLERCSVPIVQQLNMISNFRGDGEVASVLAPYYCQSCDVDVTQLIELAGGEVKPALDTTVKCPKCGESMEFDDLPETFLSFRDR